MVLLVQLAVQLGIPYSTGANNLNTSGPSLATWVKEGFGSGAGSPPANTANISSADTNLGFQIPRCFLSKSNNSKLWQEFSFDGCCSPDSMSIFNPNTPNAVQGLAANVNNSGSMGLFHARPLTDTDSLEALEVALADLGVTNPYTFASLTGYGGAVTNSRPGAVNVIVFFTDGIPSDASDAAYGNYLTNVVTPAQNNGIPIFSIGLALNPIVQVNQYVFLNTLTNNGACGSQFYQVTNSASLTSSFTGIARQLTECTH